MSAGPTAGQVPKHPCPVPQEWPGTRGFSARDGKRKLAAHSYDAAVTVGGKKADSTMQPRPGCDLPVVASPADSVSDGAEEKQNESNDEQDDPDRP